MHIFRFAKFTKVAMLLFCGGIALCGLSFWANAATSKQLKPSTNSSFRLALPGYEYSFPRDHASHPEFSTEWWYYTGHLKSKTGRQFGYQLVFFRQALMPQQPKRTSKWAMRDIIFAHLAVTDENNQKYYFTDRIARSAAGVAGAQTSTPFVWLGDWNVKFNPKNQVFQARGKSHENNTTFGLQLTVTPRKSPVIHGENGISQKSPGRGRASHYYSFTRLATQGTLQIGNESFAVSGESWFDKEFGSNQLAKNQVGWDWFSLQLNDGRELMLYQMRLDNGQVDPYSSGTLVERNGRSRHLKRDEFRIVSTRTWKSLASGATYPVAWQVELPREKMKFAVNATMNNQEMRARRPLPLAYWEGSVQFNGSQNEQAFSGRGYVELTGYDKPFQSTF